MRKINYPLIATVAAFIISGCSTSGTNGTCTVRNTAQKIFGSSAFTDPVAYCECAGTIDAPDARYKGEKIPAAMMGKIRKTMDLAPDVPDYYITLSTFWRCMDKKVYICMTGANLPCQEKADTGRSPSEPMKEFCRDNPDSDFIPATVTGRSTVYDWKCSGSQPAISKQVSFPDKKGFLSDIWYELKTD